MPPGEWVKDVPLEVVAKMIASGLTRPAFDPKLALEHLTPQVIGEYIAPNLSWGIIDEGASKAFDLQNTKPSAAGPRPSLKPPTLPNLTPPPVAATPPPPAAVAAAAEPPPSSKPAAAATAPTDDHAVVEATDWDNMVEEVQTTPST